MVVGVQVDAPRRERTVSVRRILDYIVTDAQYWRCTSGTPADNGLPSHGVALGEPRRPAQEDVVDALEFDPVIYDQTHRSTIFRSTSTASGLPLSFLRARSTIRLTCLELMPSIRATSSTSVPAACCSATSSAHVVLLHG